MNAVILGAAALLGIISTFLLTVLALLTTRLGCWVAGHDPVVLPVMLSGDRVLPVRCKRCRRRL